MTPDVKKLQWGRFRIARVRLKRKAKAFLVRFETPEPEPDNGSAIIRGLERSGLIK